MKSKKSMLYLVIFQDTESLLNNSLIVLPFGNGVGVGNHSAEEYEGRYFIFTDPEIFSCEEAALEVQM